MIFNYLTSHISKSVTEFDSENSVKTIWDQGGDEGLGRGTIRLGKAAFEALDKDRSGSITADELSGEILKVFGFDSVDSFMENVDLDKNNELNFEEFMIALIKTTGDAEESINEIIAMNNDTCDVVYMDDRCVPPEKATKYDIRYNNMLKSVSQWETDIIGAGGVESVDKGKELGRTERILYGCFSGAKDTEVVEALRAVYVDFTALRMAGDIIFKLLTKYVGERAVRTKTRGGRGSIIATLRSPRGANDGAKRRMSCYASSLCCSLSVLFSSFRLTLFTNNNRYMNKKTRKIKDKN